MSRTDLSDIPLFCLVCTQPIPEERRRYKSVVCSKEHQRMREESIQNMRDRKKCRYCFRPCTPEQRGLFRQWRHFQKYVRATLALPMLLAQVQDPEVLLPSISPKERTQLVKLLERILAQDQPPDLPPLPTKAQIRNANNEARLAGKIETEIDDDEPAEDADAVLHQEY